MLAWAGWGTSQATSKGCQSWFVPSLLGNSTLSASFVLVSSMSQFIQRPPPTLKVCMWTLIMAAPYTCQRKSLALTQTGRCEDAPNLLQATPSSGGQEGLWTAVPVRLVLQRSGTKVT